MRSRCMQKKHIHPEIARRTVSWILKNARDRPLGLMRRARDVYGLIDGSLLFAPVRRVSRVKSSSGFVYDFSVEKDENFIGGLGGIVLHNSGRRGFHLVDRIRGTLDDARLVAEDLCSSVDMEGLAPDLSLFTRRHLIRAFSVHEVSGLCSVPVSPGDTLDGIMERAKRPAGGGKGGPAPTPSTS